MRIAVLLALVSLARADVTVGGPERPSLTGVAAGCGQVAVWSDTQVWRSRDGRGFEEFPSEGKVNGAAFSTTCELWVASGRTQRLVPVRGGGMIADDGEALTLLDARGRTVRRLPDISHGNAGTALSVNSDGTLYWMWGYEAACGGGGQSRAIGHLDGRAWQPMKWEHDTSWTLGARGWAYFVTRDEHGDKLMGIDAKGIDHAIGSFGGGLWPSFSDGRRTYIVGDQQLVVLDGESARVLSSSIPAGVQQIAADERGHVWALASDGIYRLDGGWRRVRVSPAGSGLPRPL